MKSCASGEGINDAMSYSSLVPQTKLDSQSKWLPRKLLHKVSISVLLIAKRRPLTISWKIKIYGKSIFLCPRWWWQCFEVCGLNVEYGISFFRMVSHRTEKKYRRWNLLSLKVAVHLVRRSRAKQHKNGTSFTHCHRHRIQLTSHGRH